MVTDASTQTSQLVLNFYFHVVKQTVLLGPVLPEESRSTRPRGKAVTLDVNLSRLILGATTKPNQKRVLQDKKEVTVADRASTTEGRGQQS